jgi:precorrin-2/cobalt-factor-2 C20-methyltransferase
MKVGKFYGVGLGPGDPSLITLKAREILEKVDVLFAPISKKGRRSIALEIVRDLIEEKEVVRLLFPMRKDPEILRPYWEKAARVIWDKLQEGKDGAFITIGDPTFYSTYTSVLEVVKQRYPEVEIETIPGVASLQACFAGLNMPLVDRDEKLAVLPAEYGIEELSELSEIFDTIVLMKVSRSFEKIVREIEALGMADRALVVTKCGSRGFSSMPLGEVEGKVDFQSMIILKRKR